MLLSAPPPSKNLQALFCWSSIFAKTPKGREVIAKRGADLNTRQRSVLIMLDGIKRLDKLMTPIPKEELRSIVDFLANQELITVTNAAETETAKKTLEKETATPPAAINATPGSLATISSIAPAKAALAAESSISLAAEVMQQLLTDDSKLREVKDFMTTTAHTYLGLMSANLIRRIEHTKDAPQLIAMLGQWHMALCDSKHGKRFAASYLDQISATLRGENLTQFK
jgi:hypothetical protein